MNVCFNDISGGLLQYFTFSQLYEKKSQWEYFNYVENFNSNISTLRVTTNNSNLSYYQFPSLQDQNKYNVGLQLHFQYLGFSNVVQKN